MELGPKHGRPVAPKPRDQRLLLRRVGVVCDVELENAPLVSDDDGDAANAVLPCVRDSVPEPVPGQVPVDEKAGRDVVSCDDDVRHLAKLPPQRIQHVDNGWGGVVVVCCELVVH